MKSGKRVFGVIIVSLLLIGSISLINFISAAEGPQDQNLSITVTGIYAVVINIDASTLPSDGGPGQIDPLEDSIRAISFDLQVYDEDGEQDINDSTVKYKILDDPLKNGTCIFQNLVDGFTRNYSCTSFNMEYWERNGDWNIEAEASSDGPLNISTDQTTFVYNSLSAMVITPNELNWPPTSPGSQNQTAISSTIIRNTGNWDLGIQVEAYNLESSTSPNSIPADMFTIGLTNLTTEQCNVLLTDTTALQDTLAVPIFNSDANASFGGTEEFFYCIPDFPNIESATYTTNPADLGTPWRIIYG